MKAKYLKEVVEGTYDEVQSQIVPPNWFHSVFTSSPFEFYGDMDEIAYYIDSFRFYILHIIDSVLAFIWFQIPRLLLYCMYVMPVVLIFLLICVTVYILYAYRFMGGYVGTNSSAHIANKNQRNTKKRDELEKAPLIDEEPIYVRDANACGDAAKRKRLNPMDFEYYLRKYSKSITPIEVQWDLLQRDINELYNELIMSQQILLAAGSRLGYGAGGSGPASSQSGSSCEQGEPSNRPFASRISRQSGSSSELSEYYDGEGYLDTSVDSLIVSASVYQGVNSGQKQQYGQSVQTESSKHGEPTEQFTATISQLDDNTEKSSLFTELQREIRPNILLPEICDVVTNSDIQCSALNVHQPDSEEDNKKGIKSTETGITIKSDESSFITLNIILKELERWNAKQASKKYMAKTPEDLKMAKEVLQGH